MVFVPIASDASIVAPDLGPVRRVGGLTVDGNDVWFTTNTGIDRVRPAGTVETVVETRDITAAGVSVNDIFAMDVAGGVPHVATNPFGSGLGAQVVKLTSASCPTTPFSPGPTACLVADDGAPRSLGIPEGFRGSSPVDIAVDAAGVVHTSWIEWPQTAISTESSSVIRTDSGGAHSVVIAAGDVVAGQPAEGPFSIAAPATTGDLFVAEATLGPTRVLRRSAAGDWTVWLAPSDFVDNQSVGFLSRVTAYGNHEVYIEENSFDLGRSRRIIRSFDPGGGPQFSTATLGSGQFIDHALATTKDFDFRQPALIVAEADRGSGDPGRVWRIDPGSLGQIVAEASDLTTDGRLVGLVGALAADGDDIVVALQLDNGHSRIVRRAADGSITTFVDEFMTFGETMEPLGGISAIEVGYDGDIFIADTTSSRVLRFPASQSCSTPPAASVNVAKSVNCDDQVNVLDALFITQFEVGLRSGGWACPLPLADINLNLTFADVSGDGQVNVIDALFITQCEVGIPNPTCPKP